MVSMDLVLKTFCFKGCLYRFSVRVQLGIHIFRNSTHEYFVFISIKLLVLF